MNKKKTFRAFACFFLAFFFVFLILIVNYCKKTTDKIKDIKINHTMIQVEIADTKTKRIQGLADRRILKRDSGMLFIFDEKDFHYFWMKGVKFPLDFIWINDNKVVDTDENIKPGSSVFTSDVKTDMVLEVNAGFIKKNQIKVGDMVKN
jgi:uncharacterized membrane protein (UPF0127 family)